MDTFPYIVLNNKSKEKDGINVIRSNLNVFRNCRDINQKLSKVLQSKGIPFKIDISVNKENIVIETATRKVSEGDIRGSVRVLCSNDTVATQTPETVSKLKAKHPDDDGGAFEEIKVECSLPSPAV